MSTNVYSNRAMTNYFFNSFAYFVLLSFKGVFFSYCGRKHDDTMIDRRIFPVECDKNSPGLPEPESSSLNAGTSRLNGRRRLCFDKSDAVSFYLDGLILMTDE